MACKQSKHSSLAICLGKVTACRTDVIVMLWAIIHVTIQIIVSRELHSCRLQDIVLYRAGTWHIKEMQKKPHDHVLDGRVAVQLDVS